MNLSRFIYNDEVKSKDLNNNSNLNYISHKIIKCKNIYIKSKKKS